MKIKYRLPAFILAILILFTGCMTGKKDIGAEEKRQDAESIENIENIENMNDVPDSDKIDEFGVYREPRLVAEYIHIYNKLPINFVSKKEAMDLGWDSDKGNLWEVTDKMSIGGDKFGNREGLLPKKDGRVYYECDVNYEGGYRGAERIVYSNDGLVFYTDDHYKSFTQLY